MEGDGRVDEESKLPEVKTASPSGKIHAKSIPNCWELVYVLAFIHKFTDFERTVDGYDGPLEVEHALQQEGRSDLLDDVLCRFLTKMLNRKKYIERDRYFPILLEVFSTRKTDPVAWDEVQTNNGSDVFVGCQTFYDLTPHDRVQCLRLLVDWQLLESEEIRATIDFHYAKGSGKREDKNNELSVRSFGMGKKYRYYHIDESARIYKELASYSNNKWSPASSTLEEMRELATKLIASEDKKEAKTGKKLLEEILPEVEESVARKAKIAARRQRQAIELANAASYARETRTRTRQRVNYAEVENDPEVESYFKNQERMERTFSAGGASANGSSRSARAYQRNGTLLDDESEAGSTHVDSIGPDPDVASDYSNPHEAVEEYKLPLKKRRIIATYPKSDSEDDTESNVLPTHDVESRKLAAQPDDEADDRDFPSKYKESGSEVSSNRETSEYDASEQEESSDAASEFGDED